jgi:bile-acid 7alpha-dehydratase
MTDIDPEAFAQLVRDVRILKDIEAIKRVRYAYCRCMDTANFDEFRELLTPEFSCRYIGGSYEFVANGRDEFVQMIKESFNTQAATTHQLHHPEIDIVDENNAKARWYLQDVVYKYITNELIYGTLIYDDRYERRESGWKLAGSEYFRVIEVVEFPPRPPRFTSRYLEANGYVLPE